MLLVVRCCSHLSRKLVSRVYVCVLLWNALLQSYYKDLLGLTGTAYWEHGLTGSTSVFCDVLFQVVNIEDRARSRKCKAGGYLCRNGL